MTTALMVFKVPDVRATEKIRYRALLARRTELHPPPRRELGAEKAAAITT
jgi:hypothetical protein